MPLAEHNEQVRQRLLVTPDELRRRLDACPQGFAVGLKVFELVEFPIRVGALSDNAGVTAVKLYVAPGAGRFELLAGSPLAIGPSCGSV